MADLTNYGRNVARDATLGTVDQLAGDRYLRLWSDNPGLDADGTEIGGTTGQVVPFDAAGDGDGESSADVEFGNWPAGETATHATLADAASGGDHLMFAPLDAAKSPAPGGTLRFRAAEVLAMFR